MVLGYFRRAYTSFAAHVFDIPSRLFALLLFLTLLLIPTALPSPFYLSILTRASILAIFAISWDLLVGRTGQISLGHAIFFGIGGYSTAILFSFTEIPIILSIPLAILIGTFLAFLIGFLCLRVKGPYLALVTMALPLVLQRLVTWEFLNDIFKGEIGIRPLLPLFPRTITLDLPFLSIRLTSAIQTQALLPYYLILVLLFISSIVIYKIANSKTGLVFVSILDDEISSKASGINVTKYKLMSFMISGLFGTLAGALQAHFLKLVNPTWVAMDLSFGVVIVTFLGGIGTIYGPILGAYVYYILDNYFLARIVPDIFKFLQVPFEAIQIIQQTRLLIFTVIVLILIIKWPRGVARIVTDKLEDLEEARDIDERGPRIWKRYRKKET